MRAQLASTPSKKQSAKIEREISRAFAKSMDRVQVPILDIPKIYQECRTAHTLGEDIQATMEEIAARYRGEK